MLNSDPVCINMQNISDYVLIDPKSIDGGWNLRDDFPNIAPPFPLMWVEFSNPSANFRTSSDGKEFLNENISIGVLIYSSRNEEGIFHCESFWIFLTKNDDLAYQGCYIYELDKNGLLIGDKDKALLYIAPSDSAIEQIRKHGTNSLGPIMAILFMGLSLMHCKNVKLIDSPLSRQQRRYLERHASNEIRFKTLEIEPFKKTVKDIGHEGKLTSQALHVCRGHFKHFEDKPLFGKFKGTYWWPQMVRGNKRFGEIKKDYDIKV